MQRNSQSRTDCSQSVSLKKKLEVKIRPNSEQSHQIYGRKLKNKLKNKGLPDEARSGSVCRPRRRTGRRANTDAIRNLES